MQRAALPRLGDKGDKRDAAGEGDVPQLVRHQKTADQKQNKENTPNHWKSSRTRQTQTQFLSATWICQGWSSLPCRAASRGASPIPGSSLSNPSCWFSLCVSSPNFHGLEEQEVTPPSPKVNAQLQKWEKKEKETKTNPHISSV